jgi:hypothetical protein
VFRRAGAVAIGAFLAAGLLTAAAPARGPGSGPLSEAEVKSILESSLPGATFRYRRISYEGVGGKRGQTFFKIVSGDPDYEHRRYIPKRVIAPSGTVEDDLLIRVAQGRRKGGPAVNLSMSVSILIDLCDYRAGHECGPTG